MKSFHFLLVIGFISNTACNNNKQRGTKTSQQGPLNISIDPKYISNACQRCETVVENAIIYRRHGANKQHMKEYLKDLCIVYSDWGALACSGYTDIELETVLYIIDNKRDLTPKRVCAIYLQQNQCVDPNAKKWVIPLPPKLEETHGFQFERNEGIPQRILHLTDIHYDPLYVPGSDAACDEPLCCQSGTADDRQDAAGYWGDYHVCDMPRHSVDNLLARIKEKHLKNIDYVYFTGDIISHKSWATTREDNAKTFREIYTAFTNVLGETPVFPILGNHEPHPTNFFSLDNVTDPFSTRWIFELSSQVWGKWLPSDTMATIRKGGYYTVLVKPGFRIVALNSNVCYTSNLWLLYEDEDPYDQLRWLVHVLAEAERRKENVHILSHIPPGEVSCHVQWSNQYRQIVNRFASTISAQFNGHTHYDEIRLFYHPDNSSRVVNVAFNGGSFTTFVGLNPNYRIYQVEPVNATVMDYDQYVFNMTEANARNGTLPRWFKLYSFKDAYGLGDLGAKSLNEFYRKLSTDGDLLYQYFRFLVKDSEVKIAEGCDAKCLKQLLCSITAVEANSSLKC